MEELFNQMIVSEIYVVTRYFKGKVRSAFNTFPKLLFHLKNITSLQGLNSERKSLSNLNTTLAASFHIGPNFLVELHNYCNLFSQLFQ